MSAQDMLVVAEVDRDALADMSLEMLVPARRLAAATGGQVVAVLPSGDGAAFAGAWPPPTGSCWSTIRCWPAISPEPYLAAAGRGRPGGDAAGGADRHHVDRLGLGAAAGRPARTRRWSPAARRWRSRASTLRHGAFCGGKMMAESRSPAAPAMLLVLPGGFRPTERKRRGAGRNPASPLPLPAGIRRVRGTDPAGGRRRGHHAAGHPGGGGPRHPAEGEPGGGRGAGAGPRRGGGGLAPGHRPRLAAGHAAGGQVGHDGQAEVFPRPGDQRSAGACRGDEGLRPDHRRQYRPQGADLRSGPLRGGGRRAGRRADRHSTEAVRGRGLAAELPGSVSRAHDRMVTSLCRREAKILGVYGGRVAGRCSSRVATAIFLRRMYHLVRILALGRKENRLDHLGQRLGMFFKEVLCQSRMLDGRTDHQVGASA